MKSRYVEQIMIYGNSNMNNIIAIIKPNIKNCARENLNVSEEEIEKMKKDDKLIKLFVDDLDKIAQDNAFNGLEKVKYIFLDFEGFTIQNECMTPTMKIVRKKVENKFKNDIEELYKNIPMKE